MMKVLRKKRKGGFTLIELIVVIAILGILAAIAIPRLGGFSDQANASAQEANYRAVEAAVQMYIAQNGQVAADGTTVDVTSYLSDPTMTIRAPGAAAGTAFAGSVDIDIDGSWIVTP